MKITDNKPTKRNIIVEFTEEEARAMELVTEFLDDLGDALEAIHNYEGIEEIEVMEKSAGKHTYYIFSELLLAARSVLGALDDMKCDPDDIKLADEPPPYKMCHQVNCLVARLRPRACRTSCPPRARRRNR